MPARNELLTLSLTGPASHTLVRRPGYGSVTIGPAEGECEPSDLVVGPDDAIDWSVFDRLITPAGAPWPRYITYQGNDTGFVRWSAGRPVESFTWHPRSSLALDARAARIDRFWVRLDAVTLSLDLPERGAGIEILTILGDHHLFRPGLGPGAVPPATVFHAGARPQDRGPAPAGLPSFPVLAGLRDLTVTRAVSQEPFNCASLKQFPALQHLELDGSMTHLEALADLPDLRGLRLRNCPDLSGLPPLATWPRLTSVFAHDIETGAGRSLRQQIRQLARAGGRVWEHTSVTRLRTAEWFSETYGRPFATWEGHTGVVARRAYRAAEKAVAAATDAAGVEAAVRILVRRLNTMTNLGTTEREDAGDAISALTETTPAGPLPVNAATWFDEERDF